MLDAPAVPSCLIRALLLETSLRSLAPCSPLLSGLALSETAHLCKLLPRLTSDGGHREKLAHSFPGGENVKGFGRYGKRYGSAPKN